MKTIRLAARLAAILVAAGATSGAVHGQMAQQAAATAAIVPVDPFAQALAARGVADFARRQKDAPAMLTAARMLAELRFDGAGDGGGGDGSADGDGAAPDAVFTPAGLFAEARRLANGDAALLQQIRIAESTGHRGVASSNFGRGLVRSVQVVAPRANYRFNVTARANEPLRIGAIGDLGTSLMMRVVDRSGKVICLDDQGDYAPVCQTRPTTGGDYRVDIINKSAARSRTVILSN